MKIYRTIKNKKAINLDYVSKFIAKKRKRSERDLNPRNLAVLLLSRQMPSANSTIAA
ncbi:hypothetical protein DORFOR_02571 [Dorea formicigenerans ATCC 27755]|jgi:hypothetical protein|uniref:Uncharacterized protein n=1 Tax=Dorea formicigenerans ATCC 27755 TaxID=411461 RepID=B0G8G3_9FIRM|nr:hypothetical protein DORFOR_02571 [Dorea formicigenerans ATCC 27755]